MQKSEYTLKIWDINSHLKVEIKALEFEFCYKINDYEKNCKLCIYILGFTVCKRSKFINLYISVKINIFLGFHSM